MVTLTRIRDLVLSVPSTTAQRSHLNAASGLVCINSIIYVIADDELHLGVFSAADSEPGYLFRLFDGVLPDAKLARKLQKPDLESLVLLPAFRDLPHGALLALGSGSTPNRRRGVLLGLDHHGVVHGSPRSLDLSFLLAPLSETFSDVNIEGAIVVRNELRLFQRGNKGHADNAILRIQLATVLDALGTEHTASISPFAIDRLDLGQTEGVPFCFTDAAALPSGEMVFTAVAEDTDNAFDDGLCVGAAIGLAHDDGRLRLLRQLDRPHKVEGIHARVKDRRLELLLVSDADNAETPATLFSATIEVCST